MSDERITFKVVFGCGCSCGHAHRTREAANRCLKDAAKHREKHGDRWDAGRAWGIVRYHNGIEG